MTNEKLQNDCGICFVIESRKYHFSLSRSRVTVRLSSVRWENKYTQQIVEVLISFLITLQIASGRNEKSNNRDARTKHKFSITWRWFTIKIYLFAHFEAYASHFECSPINYKTQHTPKISHIAFWRSSLSSLLWFIGFMRPRNKSHLREQIKSKQQTLHDDDEHDTWPDVSLQVTSNGNQDEIL